MFYRLTLFCKALLALGALCFLGGCSMFAPHSDMTKLNLQLTGSDRLNPDLNGRPSPIVVRLYELKHPVAFENADFFSLYERAKEYLGPDLVASEELELRPGQTVELKLSVQDGSRYVGVLAAYRDLPEMRWHYTLPVVAQGITETHLTLGENGIRKADTNMTGVGEYR